MNTGNIPSGIHGRLRLALGANLGSQLTPELAASIEAFVMHRPDLAIDPAVFGEESYRGMTFRAESFEGLIQELEPLHKAHFEETEKYRSGQTLDPDYAQMAEAERCGQLVQFTARNPEGVLCGHLRVYIGRSRHTGVKVATEDTYYMLPAFRRGWAAVRLWKFAEAGLKAIGVREIRIDSKEVNNVWKLAEYLGYELVARRYAKILQE